MAKGWTFLAIAMAVLMLSQAPAPARAQTEVLKVVAVINDDVISYFDLVQRVRLGLLAARLPDTHENRQRLAWQVLQGMIAEKLQLQEARRLGISVRAGEIDEMVGRIERSNNWPPGQLRQVLAANGIPFATMQDQMRAAAAWNKVVLRRLRPLVQVSPADVDDALAKLRQNIGKPEYRVAEIFLAVDRADQEAEVRRNAERLVQQIRAGAPFPALAQQFSQSPSAGNGGDMGWLLQGQLDPQLDNALTRLQPREVSDPIRSYSGFHLLYLIERRNFQPGQSGDGTVQYVELQLPIAANARQADVTAQMNLAQEIAAATSTCADMTARARQLRSPNPEPRTSNIGDVPAEIRNDLRELRVNQVSRPIRTREGVRLVMLCGRGVSDGMPSREAMSNQILNQRLDQQARRLLRDLRQQAIVDIRPN